MDEAIANTIRTARNALLHLALGGEEGAVMVGPSHYWFGIGVRSIVRFALQPPASIVRALEDVLARIPATHTTLITTVVTASPRPPMIDAPRTNSRNPLSSIMKVFRRRGGNESMMVGQHGLIADALLSFIRDDAALVRDDAVLMRVDQINDVEDIVNLAIVTRYTYSFMFSYAATNPDLDLYYGAAILAFSKNYSIYRMTRIIANAQEKTQEKKEEEEKQK